jgi:hypothetical protein
VWWQRNQDCHGRGDEHAVDNDRCGFNAAERGRDTEQVIAALKSAGLPIGGVRSYTASTDPNKLLGRPGQYTGKANFRDRRLAPTKDFDTTSGGSVETFENRDDAKRRYDYVSAITKGSPLFAEYDYLEGNTFLRLSHELTPAQAKVYEEAFRDAL